MCLGVPGRVLSVDGKLARVDFFGLCRDVRLDVVDEPVAPGDYVLNHVGFAIRRIPAAEAVETLALYAELLRQEGPDMMAADVRSEIDATREARGAVEARPDGATTGSQGASTPLPTCEGKRGGSMTEEEPE